ncbi:MAG: pyridoxal phosphate-dependent aminotransferase [Myxococcota bacterium]|nr:pyridoxal phosphate-dependent aminotransferase [Myxococcota bacterium]
MEFSAFSKGIEPFLAMEVMERGMAMEASGRSIVQMGVGEPDFSPPPTVVEATVKALHDGCTHYTDSRGIRPLREAIAEDTFRRRGVEVDPDRILVTSGTSPALGMVFRLLLGPGDEIVIPTPHYPCYVNMVQLCGAKSVLVTTHAEDGFCIDVDEVKRLITPKTKAILVASPANPTGAVQPRSVIEGLAALGLPILSDEIYDELLFDDVEMTSPLGKNKDCFVFDGFSKRYAMTGYRVGYVIVPEAATRAMQSMQQSLHISTADFVQLAALAALKSGKPHVDMMRAAYATRRNLIVDGIRSLGLKVAKPPQGAFYVLADARHYEMPSLELAFALLDHAGVAVGPGLDFGVAAEGFVRFSYATSNANILDGLERLKVGLEHL